ncbi:hypothetical protein E2542_SST00498 [Spatholobus suberectus]|nr:hypothetical protein E2542_SST00498 [Spatholobus suberectus]
MIKIEETDLEEITVAVGMNRVLSLPSSSRSLRSGGRKQGRRIREEIINRGESVASGGCEKNENGGNYGHCCTFLWRQSLFVDDGVWEKEGFEKVSHVFFVGQDGV